MGYIRWSYRDLVSMFLGSFVWTAMGSYLLISKGKIGADLIPIFEMFMYLTPLIGIRLAFSTFFDIKKLVKDNVDIIKRFRSIVTVDILIETIFLIVFIYFIIVNDITNTGIAVFMVSIISRPVRKVRGEFDKQYQDFILTKLKYKPLLKDLRKKEDTIGFTGALIGTGLAVFCLSVLKIDIILFTKVLIVLNVIANIYGYYILYRYLR